MADTYLDITQKVVSLLKKGVAPWRRPWDTPFLQMPLNAETRRHYRGINIPLLWMAQQAGGYKFPLWGTKPTWKRLCGEVLAGQKPTMIYLFRRLKGSNVVLTSFQVYNLDQIFGCLLFRQRLAAQRPEISLDFQAGEKLFQKHDPKEVHRGQRAYYDHHKDVIHLPFKKLFLSKGGYWTTKLHELIHWTGHLLRLNRRFGTSVKSAEYAYEELVAEIGTSFLCSALNMPEALDEMPNHVSYIKDWLSIMDSDEKAVFKAASAATIAVEFLLGTKPLPEEEE